jgi:hypothetical protein
VSDDKSKRQRYALLSEYFTHLTTLNAGALALGATFLERFASQRLVWLAIVAIALFVVSLMASLGHKAAVMGKAIAEEKTEEGKTAELSPLFSFLGRFSFLEGVAESTGFLAGGSFFVAFVCLAIFAIVNLL